MQYRKFGKTGFEVSALGFGCMRLPTTEGNPLSHSINENEAIGMIRHTIDNGVNYVDSAYMYHGGRSEIVLGKALKNGYRDRVRIATKSPVHMVVKTKNDYVRVLDEQLKRLQVETIDFYMFHGLGKKSWEIVKNEDLMGQALIAKQAGKIREIGFSFHDDYPVFEEIINGYYGWSFCQIQYNYMDTQNQAGTKGLKLASSKGMGVIIMEPLLGGKLANPPSDVMKIIRGSGYDGTAADLAFQWLWSQPEVSVVLSGMSIMDQVKENLASAVKSAVRKLTQKDYELIKKIEEFYNSKDRIPCTACRYCMPCPNGVIIPRVLELYNDAITYEYPSESKRGYGFMKGRNASNCTGCRECEEKCPQKIPISEWMSKIHSMFGE